MRLVSPKSLRLSECPTRQNPMSSDNILAVISPVCFPGGKWETFWEPVIIGKFSSVSLWLKAAISVKGRHRMTVLLGEKLGRSADRESSHMRDSVMFWLLFQLPMMYFMAYLIIYCGRMRE